MLEANIPTELRTRCTFVAAEAILKQLRQRRLSVHATIADIVRIAKTRETGKWALVHQSRLYRLHSEYNQR